MRNYLRGLALRVKADSSAATLLACNIVALVFAFSNPPVSVAVMFLYWAECAVIGMVNVAKLSYLVPPNYDEAEMAAKTPEERRYVKSAAIGIFFVVPYSIVLLILFSLLYGLGEHEMRSKGVRHYDIAHHIAGFWFPVLLIASGHVSSFFKNFLGKREYVGRIFLNQMERPYKRMILMMLVMFSGVSAIIVTGLPGIALLLFIPFMIIAGLEAHFREHEA